MIFINVEILLMLLLGASVFPSHVKPSSPPDIKNHSNPSRRVLALIV
jgi:hypothetical protein